MRKLLVLGLAGGIGLVPAARPVQAVEAPLLHAEAARGTGTVEALPPARPLDKVVDGRIDDWAGEAPGWGGVAVRSRGELVYTDHLFDAYGADDGRDAERLALLDPLNEGVPETYRLDPIFQADVAGQLGFPTPDVAKAEEQYGDLDHADAADLVEVRVAPDGGGLAVLARTTTLADPGSAAVLVLVDRADGDDVEKDIPFAPGLRTVAEVAILAVRGGGQAVDLGTGASAPVPVAVAADGWDNAVELSIPKKLLGGPQVRLAVAAGTPAAGGAGITVANVAFRAEPVRTWFDKRQALALLAGSIDEFLVDVDHRALKEGANERFVPGPGYHDAVFRSSDAISTEGRQDGIWQHYGVHVPEQVVAPTPATFWLHWRGGKAHSAATVSPRIMRDLSSEIGSIVVAPRGRGTSEWWIGEGMVDVLEVRDDVAERFPIDDARVYVSGHSMGGWGSYLLSILMPDRFAAALPVAGPVTQGAWTGLDLPGCDQFRWDEYTPCYIDTNDGDARTQHTRRLLDNLRNTPIGIYQGALDELVPTSGVTRQVERLVELGYRHRYWLFPTYEHYSHPILDEWVEGARWMSGFATPGRPERVTFTRDMPFERRVEQGNSVSDPVVGLEGLDFDRAWWMSELTATDPVDGAARFDGRSLALAEPDPLLVPEAGGPASPGQAGPYVLTGLSWIANPLATPVARTNGFDVTLTGAAAVRLDLAGMGIDPSLPIAATVTTDEPLELRLGLPDGGTRVVHVEPGTHHLTL